MKKTTPIVVSIPYKTDLAKALLKYPGREITLHIADRLGAEAGHIAGPYAVWRRSDPGPAPELEQFEDLSPFATYEKFDRPEVESPNLRFTGWQPRPDNPAPHSPPLAWGPADHAPHAQPLDHIDPDIKAPKNYHPGAVVDGLKPGEKFEQVGPDLWQITTDPAPIFDSAFLYSMALCAFLVGAGTAVLLPIVINLFF